MVAVEINNGGCWKQTKDDTTYSACMEGASNGCKCPAGFKGDGVESCEDVDECKERIACQCPECKCKNTWGSYECSCSGDLLYMREHDTYISLKFLEQLCHALQQNPVDMKLIFGITAARRTNKAGEGKGLVPLAGSNDESWCQGLDGLASWCAAYY